MIMKKNLLTMLATIRVAYADTGMPTAETLAEEISRLNE